MTRWTALAWLVLAFIAGPTSSVDACSCLGRLRPCEAFWQTDLVFIGVVRSVTVENVTGVRSTYELSTYTFDVFEALRGEPGQTIVIRSGTTSCDRDFDVGETYVVYAWREEGDVKSSGCNRTSRLADALVDLAYIRGLSSAPPSDAGGLLTATVGRGGIEQLFGLMTEAELMEAPVKRAIGYPVSLTLTSERFSMVVESRDAPFDVRVPPGGYRVVARAPSGFYAQAYPDFIALPDARACAEVELVLAPDGHVTGQVLDAEGEPAAGVEMGVVPAGMADTYLPIERATTGEDGRFEIWHVTPGKYIVRPVMPGPAVRSSAFGPLASRTIEMRASVHEDVGQIRLPAGLALRTIRGSVVDVDGTPMPGVLIFPSPVTPGDTYEHFGYAGTDDDGRFVIAIPVDRQFVIRAERERYRLDERGRPDRVTERVEAPVTDSNEVQLILKRTP